MKSTSAVDIYLIRVFKLAMVTLTGSCLCAGAVFSLEKLLGFYASVPWAALIVFLCTNVTYVVVGFVFMAKVAPKGVMNRKVLAAGKVFVTALLLIQYNFILYMIPSHDIWYISVYFIVIPMLFLDYRVIGVINGGLLASMAVSWFLRGGAVLPVNDELFVPELILRVVILLLFFTVSFLITFLVNRFLIGSSDSRMSAIMGKVNALLERLNESSKILTVSAQDENEVAEKLSGIADRLLEDSGHMLTRSRQSRENLQQLGASSVSINQLMEEMNGISGELVRISRENETDMNDLVDLSRKVETSTQNTQQVAGELQEGSSNIGKSLEEIDSIAQTTNILALNAAVEAARAGTAGKGFAIVAEEVRNLASKTKKALDNVNAVVSAVQSGTVNVHSTMGISAEQLTAQNRLLFEMVDRIRRLMALLNKSAEATSGANAMNHKQNGIIQTTVSLNEEIARSIETEYTMFGDIAEYARKSKTDIARMHEQVASLNTMIRELDELLTSN